MKKTSGEYADPGPQKVGNTNDPIFEKLGNMLTLKVGNLNGPKLILMGNCGGP